LKKDYLIQLLPNFFSLRDEHLKLLVSRLLNSQPAPLSPSEFLVQLHLMSPRSSDKDKKKFYEQVRKVVLFSLRERVVQDQQVLGSVLSQLVERHPLPQLFLKTLTESLKVFKPLTQFAMGLLSRLVRNKVWEDTEIWKDFIRCCASNQPFCYPVLKDLPKNQFSQLLQAGKMVQLYQSWVSSNANVRLSRDHQKVLEKLTRNRDD
jgi:symplekin